MEKSKVFILLPLQEIRVKINKGKTVLVKLLNGTAEIFGCELVLQIEQEINRLSSFSIFSWNGCSVKLSNFEDAHVGDGSDFVEIFEFHQKVIKNVPKRIMVLGGENSGRSSNCKSLINYAIRQGEKVMLIDLDIKSNMLVPPGSVAATFIKKPILSDSDIQENPIVCFLGNEVVDFDTKDRYLECVKRLLKSVLIALKSQFKKQIFVVTKLNSVGMVNDFDILNKILLILENYSFIGIGIDFFINKIEKEISKNCSKKVNLLKINRSSAIIPLCNEGRKLKRDNRFKSYFYGLQRELFPSLLNLKFGTFFIYKLTEQKLPISALPKGEKEDEVKVPEYKSIKPTKKLTNLVLAVAGRDEPKKDFNFIITGYVHITSVDESRREICLLCPSQMGVGTNRFFYSDIKWIDRE